MPECLLSDDFLWAHKKKVVYLISLYGFPKEGREGRAEWLEVWLLHNEELYFLK